MHDDFVLVNMFMSLTSLKLYSCTRFVLGILSRMWMKLLRLFMVQRASRINNCARYSLSRFSLHEIYYFNFTFFLDKMFKLLHCCVTHLRRIGWYIWPSRHIFCVQVISKHASITPVRLATFTTGDGSSDPPTGAESDVFTVKSAIIIDSLIANVTLRSIYVSSLWSLEGKWIENFEITFTEH